MNVHCQFCRHSFNVGRDFMSQAVAEADEKRQKYCALECPKCRKINKVSVKQMRRFVPKPAQPTADEE
ncbi:MAG: hypothetical protein CSA11_00645 [Chloroflexi bacterium]|nr:MAG: hypothetical protein CSB13_07275 [Chloroflexota bacterium]PIE82432.1 MAG: hypothetical protein CSA11_00645 [Chloroflexota bacterium]